MKKIVPLLALGLFLVAVAGCSDEPKPAGTTPPAVSSPATPSTNATKPATGAAPQGTAPAAGTTTTPAK